MRVRENGLNLGFGGDGERIGTRAANGEGERFGRASAEKGIFSCWFGRGGSGGGLLIGVGASIVSWLSSAAMDLGNSGFLWIGALTASGCCGSESK